MTGTVKAVGPRPRALSLQPGSALAFADLEIPKGSRFEAGAVALELWVDGERIAERAQQGSRRWEADLGKYGGRRVELKLRSVGEVLVVEPRVVWDGPPARP